MSPGDFACALAAAGALRGWLAADVVVERLTEITIRSAGALPWRPFVPLRDSAFPAEMLRDAWRSFLEQRPPELRLEVWLTDSDWDPSG